MLDNKFRIEIYLVIGVILFFLLLNFIGDKYKENQLKKIEYNLCNLYCVEGKFHLNVSQDIVTDCLMKCGEQR